MEVPAGELPRYRLWGSVPQQAALQVQVYDPWTAIRVVTSHIATDCSRASFRWRRRSAGSIQCSPHFPPTRLSSAPPSPARAAPECPGTSGGTADTCGLRASPISRWARSQEAGPGSALLHPDFAVGMGELGQPMGHAQLGNVVPGEDHAPDVVGGCRNPCRSWPVLKRNSQRHNPQPLHVFPGKGTLRA